MLDILLLTSCLDDMGDYPNQGSVCVGCGSPILDPYLLRVAPDLEWHAACLTCAQCGVRLDETCTCFVRDGKTYCKRDYVWLFGTKCATCSIGLGRRELVMRAHGRVFHTDCFRCASCSRAFVPGDQVLLRGEELLCRRDYEMERMEHGSLEAHDRALVKRPSERHTSLHRHHAHAQKSTRVRTVLNERQLHTLRTCYNANPRPDALMKEQLVEMTGLSPRVIRVWFQNKRCKDKKRSLQLKDARPGLRGTLLTAASPVHNESSEGELVEVHQPVWKSFEVTLQRALEPHIFQVSLSDSQSSSSASDASLSSDTGNSLVFSPGDMLPT
uniref:Islet n=1 Tax=Knipowitschia caucasica TaxID=637954 RepID=A0AAV2L125_KNICA